MKAVFGCHLTNYFYFYSPEVIDKYKSKIQGLEKDLKEILKQESEEKEVCNPA